MLKTIITILKIPMSIIVQILIATLYEKQDQGSTKPDETLNQHRHLHQKYPDQLEHVLNKITIILTFRLDVANFQSRRSVAENPKYYAIQNPENGRAAARRTAPKLLRFIRAGPNEGAKKMWGLSGSLSRFIRGLIWIY